MTGQISTFFEACSRVPHAVDPAERLCRHGVGGVVFVVLAFGAVACERHPDASDSPARETQRAAVLPRTGTKVLDDNAQRDGGKTEVFGAQASRNSRLSASSWPRLPASQRRVSRPFMIPTFRRRRFDRARSEKSIATQPSWCYVRTGKLGRRRVAPIRSTAKQKGARKHSVTGPRCFETPKWCVRK